MRDEMSFTGPTELLKEEKRQIKAEVMAVLNVCWISFTLGIHSIIFTTSGKPFLSLLILTDWTLLVIPLKLAISINDFTDTLQTSRIRLRRYYLSVGYAAGWWVSSDDTRLKLTIDTWQTFINPSIYLQKAVWSAHLVWVWVYDQVFLWSLERSPLALFLPLCPPCCICGLSSWSSWPRAVQGTAQRLERCRDPAGLTVYLENLTYMLRDASILLS